MTEDMLPYRGMAKVPQFVVTHEAREPVTVGDLTFTFVTGGIWRAIEMARAAAGEKRVALLGASIGQQCLRAGLVDEIMIHIVPLLLGEGIRLFDNLNAGEIELERTDIVATSAITSLRLKVVK